MSVIRGNLKYDSEQKFIFNQVQECVFCPSKDVADAGCITFTLRAMMPHFPGTTTFGDGIPTALYNGGATAYNQLGVTPFSVPTLEARDAFSRYQYGVVTKTHLKAQICPSDECQRSTAPDLATGTVYAPQAVCYLTVGQSQFPHGTSTTTIQSNEANQLLIRQGRSSTDVGSTHAAVGTHGLGCTLERSYYPRKTFEFQGGEDLIDNLGDGSNSTLASGGGFMFEVAQWNDGSGPPPVTDVMKNWTKQVDGPSSELTAYYTLTIVSKYPGSRFVGTAPVDGVYPQDSFAFGRILPHKVIFTLETFVHMFNFPSDIQPLSYEALKGIRSEEGAASQRNAKHAADTTQDEAEDFYNEEIGKNNWKKIKSAIRVVDAVTNAFGTQIPKPALTLG